MCGKIMTVLLIFVVLNCSMARYNGRLHCIVGVLPTCYKRKAATYFYPPGGTGPDFVRMVIVVVNCCVVALRPQLTAMVMSGRSVNITTLFQGMLNQFSVPTFAPVTETALLESVEGARVGNYHRKDFVINTDFLAG